MRTGLQPLAFPQFARLPHEERNFDSIAPLFGHSRIRLFSRTHQQSLCPSEREEVIAGNQSLFTSAIQVTAFRS